jgi:hypothetical protein
MLACVDLFRVSIRKQRIVFVERCTRTLDVGSRIEMEFRIRISNGSINKSIRVDHYVTTGLNSTTRPLYTSTKPTT